MSTSTLDLLKLIPWIAGLAIGAELWSTTAVAQSANDFQAQDAGVLKTIVVSAEKRSEDLQKVPISVAVLSASDLSKSHIQGTEDLVGAVPGLSLGQINGYLLPSLRGMGEYIAINGYESPVATYLDGVYLVQPAAGLFGLANTHQIEVLRGPQGTLFGRNATAGVIDVITNDPSHVTALKADLGYGSFDTVNGDVYATGAVADNLAANISVSGHKEFTGEIRNVNLGTRPADDQSLGVQNKWLWTSTDKATDVTLNLRYDYLMTNLFDGIAPGFLAADGVTRWLGQQDVSNRVDPFAKTDTYLASIRVNHEFGWGKIMDLAAYRKFSSEQLINQNGIPGNIVNPITNVTPTTLIDPRTDDGKTLTNEFQVQALPGAKVQWVGGFYYLHDVSSTNQLVDLNEAFSFQLWGTIVTKSYATFGQATFPVRDDTRLTVGARYTSDTDELSGTQTHAPFNVQQGGINPKTTKAEPTFRLSLDHDFLRDTLGYVSWNRGFRSGQYTINNFTNPAVKPEITNSYEAGLKNTLFNHRLRLNVAAFRYVNDDMQLKATTIGGVSELVNAAKAHGQGVDLDVDAILADNLTFSGGFEVLDAKFDRFLGAPCPTDLPQGGVNGAVTCDLSGARLPFAPKFSTNVQANYSIPTSMGRFGFTVGDGFSSGYNFEPDGAIRQPSFHNVTGSLTWARVSGGLSVTLWGRNLLDADLFELGTTNSSRVMVPGAVRTFGVSVGVEM